MKTSAEGAEDRRRSRVLLLYIIIPYTTFAKIIL